MSEKPKFEDPIATQGIDTAMQAGYLQPFDSRLTGDSGAIDIGEIAGKSGELAKDYLVDPARIAYHGVRQVISTGRGRLSEKRMSWADKRQERMEHKDDLYSEDIYADEKYSDLAGQTTTKPRTNPVDQFGNIVKPRTVVERFVDRRLEKRWEKHGISKIRAYRADRVFGPSDSLPGKSKLERAGRRTRIFVDAHKGRISARDANMAKLENKAAPLKLGAKMHKQASRGFETTGKRLKRSADQPVSSRWRSWRHNQAAKDEQRHDSNADKHFDREMKRRNKKHDIRTNRTNRKQARVAARTATGTPTTP